MGTVERVVVAMGAGAGAWGGMDRTAPCQSGSRAEMAGWIMARLHEGDAAVLAWECGRDEPAIQGLTWRRIMLEARVVAAESPREWPAGRMQALVGVAMVDLPRRERLRPWEALDLLRKAGHEMHRRSWERVWEERYEQILQSAYRCAARARGEITAAGRMSLASAADFG